MKEPIEKVTYTFPLSDISNKALTRIGITMKFVQFFYHNTEQTTQYREAPLPTDELPFIITGIENENLSVEELRMLSTKWLIQKAIEDFVVGINLCLEEANRFFRVLSISSEGGAKAPAFPTKEEIEEKLKKIDLKVKKVHIPIHISEIEKFLKKELDFKAELLSVNKVRNCMVHRDGVVHDVDFNDTENQCLKLQWVELNGEVRTINDDWEKLTFELRKNGVDVKGYRVRVNRFEKIFSKDEEIGLSINDLNGIGLTCIHFIMNLYEDIHKSLPKGSKVTPL